MRRINHKRAGWSLHQFRAHGSPGGVGAEILMNGLTKYLKGRIHESPFVLGLWSQLHRSGSSFTEPCSSLTETGSDGRHGNPQQAQRGQRSRGEHQCIHKRVTWSLHPLRAYGSPQGYRCRTPLAWGGRKPMQLRMDSKSHRSKY